MAAQAMSFFCLSVKTCLSIRNLDLLIWTLYHILPAVFEQTVKLSLNRGYALKDITISNPLPAKTGSGLLIFYCSAGPGMSPTPLRTSRGR